MSDSVSPELPWRCAPTIVRRRPGSPGPRRRTTWTSTSAPPRRTRSAGLPPTSTRSAASPPTVRATAANARAQREGAAGEDERGHEHVGHARLAGLAVAAAGGDLVARDLVRPPAVADEDRGLAPAVGAGDVARRRACRRGTPDRPHAGEHEIVGLDEEAVVERGGAGLAVVGPAIVPLHDELEAVGARQRDGDARLGRHLEPRAVPARRRARPRRRRGSRRRARASRRSAGRSRGAGLHRESLAERAGARRAA